MADVRGNLKREEVVKEEARTFSQLVHFMQTKDEEPDQMLNFQTKLKKNRMLGRMTNKSGYTPLHIGIQMEAPWKKIAMLLMDREVARQRNPAGRFPLHMALDYYPKEELLNSLIDMHPPAVKEMDVDMRLPLHVVLEMPLFTAQYAELASKMIKIYPHACHVKFPDGRLPLHIALDRSLPTMLVQQIFTSHRSAAGVPKRDGRYPLHLALENEVEVSVVAKIVEAHPKALTTKMSLAGRRCLPLEYAMKKKYPLPAIKTLMSGDESDNPKVLAYARSVAVGRIGKECRASGSSRGGKTIETVSPLTVSRHTGKLVVQDFDEASEEDSKKAKCLIRSDDGLLLTVYCSSEENIEDLRLAVTAAEAKALHLQEKDGTLPEEQRLTYGANQLHDGHSLAFYGITKEVMIYLRPRCEIIHEALRQAREDEIVLKLLLLRPEVATEDDANGVLPLHIALMHQASVEVVEQLIAQHPQAGKLPVEGTLGQYPLHVALKSGYYPPKTITLLLEAKASVGSDAMIVTPPWEGDWTDDGIYSPGRKDPDPENCLLPLHMAIMHSGEGSHVQDNVKLLVSHKCPIQARDRTTGHSAVECCLASKRGDDLFQIIFSEAESQAPDSLFEESAMGQLPIHVACTHGASVNIVETLWEWDPGALMKKDKDGRLPIHLALANQMPFNAIRFLMEKMMEKRPDSVRECDGQGHSLLQLAALHQAAPGVVQQIVRLDPEAIHVVDYKGRSILVMAVAANAPPWVLKELCRSCPEEVQKICILQGGWPNTKAATEVMRMISGPSERPQDGLWKATLGVNDGRRSARKSLAAQPPPPNALTSGSPRSDSDPNRIGAGGGGDSLPAVSGSQDLPPLAIESGIQDQASCEIPCTVS